MEYLKVGVYQFPKVGLGTFPMKGDALKQSLSFAVNNGYTLIDTAFKYHNEAEIASFLSKQPAFRNSVIIQTKFSITQLTDKKFLCFKYGKTTIDDAIEGSMRRLEMPCLDVYLLHAPSKGYVDYYGSLLRFKEQKKVKITGVCRFNERQLQDIKDVHGVFPELNQIEVHPFYSNRKVIDFCKANGIAIEARSVLTHGDALERLMHSKVLKDIAADCGKTIPQVVIRWVVQQDLIAIVKSETQKHIADNAKVFDFYLTDAQMKKIDSLNEDKSFGCISNQLKGHD